MKNNSNTEIDLNRIPGMAMWMEAAAPYRILACNEEAERLRPDWTGSFFLELLNGDKYRQRCTEAFEKEQGGHFRVILKGMPLKYEVKAKKSSDGRKILVLMEEADGWYDGTETDALTGLPRRRQFLTLAAQYMQKRNASDYAFVYFNIIDFKGYNRRHGIEEGDAFLRKLAARLKEIFPQGILSRFGEDHFVLLDERQGLEEALQQAGEALHEIGEDSNVLKAGICLGTDAQNDPQSGCDYAKTACDWVHDAHDHRIAVFSEKMKSEEDIESYTSSHIDEAIRKGWIKVYYQPVVRSFTRALCGAEALARWEDPEKGMLAPVHFIRALEKSEQICKLDLCIINQVCARIRQQLDRHENAVPVSLNLSRLDFTEADMLAEVEKAVKKYDVPRDMLHIEITEDAFANSDEWLVEKMQQFQKKGYEIWMDDFGSGYSSLNLIRKYSFRLIKIDMDFMKDDSQASRQIISSIVNMAKNLGIHTLCEGVETEDQYAFLKACGCEKIQGYLIGRPMPYEEMIHRVRQELGLPVEKRNDKKYCDEIGGTDFQTDLPFILVEKQGRFLRVFYANESARKMFRSSDSTSAASIEDLINSPLYAVHHNLRQVMEQILRTRTNADILISADGSYYRFHVSLLARQDRRAAFRIQLVVSTEAEAGRRVARADQEVRNIINIFDEVGVIRGDRNELEILRSSLHPFAANEVQNLDQSVENAMNIIYPDDQERYRRFMNTADMDNRIAACTSGVLTDAFRMSSAQGSYEWKLIAIVRVHGEGEHVWLKCVRQIDGSESRVIQHIAEAVSPHSHTGKISPEVLWNSLVRNTDIKMFWKDRNRRFLGVSRAFLQYYHLHSDTEILGKTDEDMKWHVNAEPFRDDELAVIEEGKTIEHAAGRCIVDGINHDIVAWKMPLYADGRIEGLIGWFEDADTYALNESCKKELQIRDPLTGLLNMRGFLDTRLSYEEEYQLNHRPYGLILLEQPGFASVKEDYGRAAADALLQTMGDIIRRHVSLIGVGCRISGSTFALLVQPDSAQELAGFVKELAASLEDIHEVNGNPVTVRMNCQMAVSTDPEGIQRILHRIDFA